LVNEPFEQGRAFAREAPSNAGRMNLGPPDLEGPERDGSSSTDAGETEGARGDVPAGIKLFSKRP